MNATRTVVARRSGPRQRPGNWLPYLLVLPAAFLLGVILVPSLIALYYSFTNYTLLNPTHYKLVGLANYVQLFNDPVFWRSSLTSVKYAGLSVAIEMPLGLALAILLNRSLPGMPLFRALLVLPLMLPPVIGGLMWKVMLAPVGGVINHLVQGLGVPPTAWLGSPTWALPVVVLIDVWLYTAPVALICLAGLQSLPEEPFEAALIDGAGDWQIFRHITLPLVRPFLMIALIFRFVDALKTFDVIFSTTQGGPGQATKALQPFLYEMAFRSNLIAYAIAISVVVFIVLQVVSSLLIRYWRTTADTN